MLKQLELYINAQKTIANYSMALGVFLLMLAIIFYFAGTNSLFNGLKIGLLVLGFISLGSGYGYRITEEKLLSKQSALHLDNPSHFHQIEKERMAKVMKNFPVYQLVFMAVIIISLLIIFFSKNSFMQGILFSVIIYLLGNLVIEKVSKTSIDHYYEQLSNS